MFSVNLIQRFHLFLFKWIKVNDIYYIKCETHGLTNAVVHGYDDDVSCRECLLNEVSQLKKGGK